MRLVSSAAITSAVRRVSKARAVMSPRLPMGVDTIYKRPDILTPIVYYLSLTVVYGEQFVCVAAVLAIKYERRSYAKPGLSVLGAVQQNETGRLVGARMYLGIRRFAASSEKISLRREERCII